MKMKISSNSSQKCTWHSNWTAMPRFIKNVYIKKFASAVGGILLSIFAYFILGSYKTPVAIFFVSFSYFIISCLEYRRIEQGSLISIDLICKNVDYQVKSIWKLSLSSTTKITLYFKGIKDNKVYFLLSSNSNKLKTGDHITIFLFPQDLHASDNDTFYISNYVSIQKFKNAEL